VIDASRDFFVHEKFWRLDAERQKELGLPWREALAEPVASAIAAELARAKRRRSCKGWC
jgi:hypothetical protein